MNLQSLAFAAVVALIAPGMAAAQAPAGSTGMCKDGTYSTAASKRGACAGHGGVKDWFESKAGDTKAEQKPAVEHATASPSPGATAPASPSAAAPASSSPKSSTTMASAAPGGGAGKVWVNSSTKVYHCENDRWYGKTKHGEYLSESEAKEKGFRASHGKACG